METVYSGVVSIRNLRLAMFLAELNDLELWGADVGNAYLQALTREKLYIVGGPEFEELQGHVLVMYKALYPHFQRGFNFKVFSNQPLETSIEIPYETSNVIQ